MGGTRRGRLKAAADPDKPRSKQPEMVWTLDLRDQRRLWQNVDPQSGLTLRQAMLFYDEENLADLVLDLEGEGYDGDPPMLVGIDGWPTPNSVISEFRVKSERLREARRRLEFCLVQKLVRGRLIATGFSNTAVLDEAPSRIVADRWRVLVPDFIHSEATGHGTVVDGIFVFEPGAQASDVAEAQPRFSQSELRAWYIARVHELQRGGLSSSRDSDLEAAKAAFHTRIPRDELRRLRRELAPLEWTRLGRRKQSR